MSFVYMGEPLQARLVAGRQGQGDAQESKRDHTEATRDFLSMRPHA